MPYRIEYRKNAKYEPGDIPGIDQTVTYAKGEAFDVDTQADAKRYHPAATVVGKIGYLGVIEPITTKKAASNDDAPVARHKAADATKVADAGPATPAAPDGAKA